jgi:hypothetical protein
VDDSRVVALKILPTPHDVKGVIISLVMQGSTDALLKTFIILILQKHECSFLSSGVIMGM